MNRAATRNYELISADSHFVNVPEEERWLILAGNCERLYGLG